MIQFYLKKITNTISTSWFQSKTLLVLILDIVIVCISLQLSIYLRLGEEISLLPYFTIILNTCLYALFGISIFSATQLYKGPWQYASVKDLVTLFLSVTGVTILYLPTQLFLPSTLSLPKEAPFINWFVLMILLGTPRLLYRLYKNKASSLNPLTPQKTILVVGAGNQTHFFIQEILRKHDDTYLIRGIIEGEMIPKERKIHHVDVIGSIEEIPFLLESFKKKNKPIDMLVVADQDLTWKDLKSILEKASSSELHLTRLPRLGEITSPHTKVRVRPLEIEEIFSQPQQNLDKKVVNTLIAGKRVLITGAGEAFGSELVRQISNFSPSHLCLVDHSETLLCMTELELKESHSNLLHDIILADVTCRETIRNVIETFKPDIVIHTAALKRLNAVEDNLCQAALTNVIGTRNVADACRDFNVPAMVHVSTDKAINPTSLMGATKRLAECYCQALDILERQKSNGTRYISVRVGNIFGSPGSVVPLFKRQIQNGGPITLTHPEAMGNFISGYEASIFILKALAFSINSNIQGGRVFVLDLGDPIKILDIARQMLCLAGLKPNIDIEIRFTGLSAGDKLFENSSHSAEHLIPTDTPKLLIDIPRTVDHGFLTRALNELEGIAREQDQESLLRLLQALVPEYKSLNQLNGIYLKTAS